MTLNYDDLNLTNQTFAIVDYPNSILRYINAISILLLIIFMCGTFFNLVSIYVIFKLKKLQPINILILNLALADIIYASGIPMFVSNEFNKHWPFGLVGCRIFFLSDYIGMIVGVYSVVALSVERYVEVTDRRKKLEEFSDKFKIAVTLFYIIIVWLFAVIFALPIVLSFETATLDNGLVHMCDSTWNDLQLNIFFIIKYVFLFIIPFAIILFSSIKLLVFLNVWKKKLFKFKKPVKLDSSTRMEATGRNSEYTNATDAPIEMCLINRQKKHSNYTVKSYDTIINESKRSTLSASQLFNRRTSEFSNYQESKRSKVFVPYKRSKNIRLKAIKIVLSIVLLFFIQWTPLWLFELYKALTNDFIQNVHLINAIITLISYSNSISNPLLYIFLTVSFQKFIGEITSSIRFKKVN